MSEETTIHLVVPIFLLAYGVGIAWLCYQAVRTFGWQSLMAKLALFINGIFFPYLILNREAPWMAHRHAPRPLHLSTSVDVVAYVWLMIWFYLLLSPRAMGWLMKPPFKWISYSCAAFWLAASFAARKGWF